MGFKLYFERGERWRMSEVMGEREFPHQNPAYQLIDCNTAVSWFLEFFKLLFFLKVGYPKSLFLNMHDVFSGLRKEMPLNHKSDASVLF